MNSQRRRIDSSGRTFMPMNMDISDNDEFMTLPKVIVLFCIIASYVVWVVWGRNISLNIIGWIITFIGLTFIDQLLLRYIIFQEKYYYSIWKRDKRYGDPKASIFWNISSYKRTGVGDIMVYSDLKLGCFLELEKDTIIGREQDSMEKHFDAWSEFYKHVHLLGYKYVQMNIMEPAGKDIRLDELADIASNSKNEGVRTVLEYSTGYMKEISRATLNEKDYILIYTTQTNKMNSIINDVQEVSSHLLDGAYASVRIMTAQEVYQLPKELWNVGYFDGIEAQMDVYKHSGYSIKNPFKITQLNTYGGQAIKITPVEERRITKASKLLDNEKISLEDWSIDSVLSGEFERNQYKTMVSDNKSIHASVERVTEPVLTKEKKKKEKKKMFDKKSKTVQQPKFNDDIEEIEDNLEDEELVIDLGDTGEETEGAKPEVKKQEKAKVVKKTEKPVKQKKEKPKKEKKSGGLFGKKSDEGFDLSKVNLDDIEDDEYVGTDEDEVSDDEFF